MKTEERDLLITEATSAHRERLRDRVLPCMAFVDLDEQGRDELFARTVGLRRLESALDGDGLTTTGHAVLARLP
ncbi:MAG: hypothetical protein KJO07_17630 [Deltaproteobacteria bacterium]|jgi:hypothetical protein|nr:hypothetical protein [Deltaproteobacteria bacterium]